MSAPLNHPNPNSLQPTRGGPGGLLTTFPAEVRKAHEDFLASGDPAALDAVVLAVVLDHCPRNEAGEVQGTQLGESARLMEDLGLDSLALAEIVFFFEDLYGLLITNQDLKAIRTLADIRAFVRTSLAAARPA
jgi:acyl carrier protein